MPKTKVGAKLLKHVAMKAAGNWPPPAKTPVKKTATKTPVKPPTPQPIRTFANRSRTKPAATSESDRLRIAHSEELTALQMSHQAEIFELRAKLAEQEAWQAKVRANFAEVDGWVWVNPGALDS